MGRRVLANQTKADRFSQALIRDLAGILLLLAGSIGAIRNGGQWYSTWSSTDRGFGGSQICGCPTQGRRGHARISALTLQGPAALTENFRPIQGLIFIDRCFWLQGVCEPAMILDLKWPDIFGEEVQARETMPRCCHLLVHILGFKPILHQRETVGPVIDKTVVHGGYPNWPSILVNRCPQGKAIDGEAPDHATCDQKSQGSNQHGFLDHSHGEPCMKLLVSNLCLWPGNQKLKPRTHFKRLRRKLRVRVSR